MREILKCKRLVFTNGLIVYVYLKFINCVEVIVPRPDVDGAIGAYRWGGIQRVTCLECPFLGAVRVYSVEFVV